MPPLVLVMMVFALVVVAVVRFLVIEVSLLLAQRSSCHQHSAVSSSAAITVMLIAWVSFEFPFAKVFLEIFFD